uniref:carbonic anhydrase 6 n=1 Tax=Jaculus jaculus TaxID=51337 RepID=UPI0003331C54|nr:carbonic anhydrase 6 [Jaculus jaculus]
MRALVTLASVLLLGAQAHGWSYSDGELNELSWPEEYPECGGQRQSPINVQRRSVKFNPLLKPLNLTGYEKEGDFPMTNNGHTVQITLPHTMRMTASDGTVFAAQQMHFHWGGGSWEVSGSEHTIDGSRRVIEVHVVHYNIRYGSYDEAKDKPDGLAVLAAFAEIQEYAENTYYSNFISELANIKYPGQTTALKDSSIQVMLPVDLYRYYTYEGSLTTPPCTQNVKWFILDDSIKLSKIQVLNIENSIKNHKNETLHDGYRRTQPLHGRRVEANFPYFANHYAQCQYYLKTIDDTLGYLTKSLGLKKSKKKNHN